MFSSQHTPNKFAKSSSLITSRVGYNEEMLIKCTFIVTVLVVNCNI